jgi:hypothetical protein
MQDLTAEMESNQQFQDFWKTLEPAFIGVLPPMMGAFKECAYRAFVAGFNAGYEEAEDDHAISLEAESDY